jgi:hypothetical protein
MPYIPYFPNAQYPAATTQTTYASQTWPPQAAHYGGYSQQTTSSPYFNHRTSSYASGSPAVAADQQSYFLTQPTHLSPISGGPSTSDFNSRSPSSEETESASSAMYVNHIERSQLQVIHLVHRRPSYLLVFPFL